MSNRTLRRAAERQAHKAEKRQPQTQSQPQTKSIAVGQSDYDPNELLEEIPHLSPELQKIMERHHPGDTAERESFNEMTRSVNAPRIAARANQALANPPTNATGPKSPEGKQISSRNALKHGSCSTATLILPHESRADFDALEARWSTAYQPKNEYEIELIRTAARAEWFFQRADRNYAEVEFQIMNEEPNLLAWTESHHRTLARFQRYRTTNSNLLAKHRKALEDYRKNRTSEAHKEEKMEMARDRHRIYQQKNEPDNLEHNLEGYRRKAIELGLRPADSVR